MPVPAHLVAFRWAATIVTLWVFPWALHGQVAIVRSTPLTFVRQSDGRLRAAGELYLVNLAAENVELRSVEIRREAGGPTVALYRDSALSRQLARLGASPGKGRDPLLGPGSASILFLDLEGDSLGPPSKLAITIRSRRESADSDVVQAFEPTPGRMAPTLEPPIRGDMWRAGTSGHRRAVSLTGSRLENAQRFAFDLYQLADDGMLYRGDSTRNESYLSFGAPVYAAQRGRVVEAVDSIPDNRPMSVATSVTETTIAGNHVLIRHSDGTVALYAHLRRGSVQVRVGQLVATGARLGAIGNSGQSSGPHLHFHLADAASVLSADGIPFTFAGFVVIGNCRPDCRVTEPKAVKRAMPQPEDLIAVPVRRSSNSPQ